MKTKQYFAMELWDINYAASLILNMPPIGWHYRDSEDIPYFEDERPEYFLDRSNEIVYNDIKLAIQNGNIEHKIRKKLFYVKKESLIRWFIDNPKQQHHLSDEFLSNCCSLYFANNFSYLSEINEIRKRRLLTKNSMQLDVSNQLAMQIPKEKQERDPNIDKMLLLIFGMATAKWSYEPENTTKASPAGKIKNDIYDSYGVIIDDDTIRGYLRNGYKVFEKLPKNKKLK